MSDARAAKPATSPTSPAGRKHKPSRIALLSAAVILLLLSPVAREHLRAMSLLARMGRERNWIARLDHHIYDVQAITFATPAGAVRAKLYVPRDAQHPPAMVVVHGLHQLGMEEPRLVTFAESLAETGIEVLTPQVDAIADYRVEPQSIDVIGASAQELARRSASKVGVLGLSFAGGLSLMAAAEPKYADEISFVAAVGAQDDVQRVEHYLVDGSTHWPNGALLNVPPHEYGWLILIYSHPEDFFPAADAEPARNVLRLLLHEDVRAARTRSRQLSPTGQQLMNAIFNHRREEFRQRLLADLDRHSAEAIAISPRGHLQTLKARVLLIHGEGDTVIPPSETEWLARDVPRGKLEAALVSRAISHVSLQSQPGWADRFAAIHWIALMLADADRETRSYLNLN